MSRNRIVHRKLCLIWTCLVRFHSLLSIPSQLPPPPSPGSLEYHDRRSHLLCIRIKHVNKQQGMAHTYHSLQFIQSSFWLELLLLLVLFFTLLTTRAAKISIILHQLIDSFECIRVFARELTVVRTTSTHTLKRCFSATDTCL